ncbi:MAG: alkaline phosphatase, partial [Candidatus Nephrothrix sp. EaCA]
MIDLKTDAVPALKKLMETLGDYPQLTSMTKLRLVISGNRPRPSQFASYPAYLWFDGELNKTYSQDELRRVPLFSANFKEYSNWNG